MLSCSTRPRRIPQFRTGLLFWLTIPFQLQLLVLRERLSCRCCPPARPPAVSDQEHRDRTCACWIHDWCLYVVIPSLFVKAVMAHFTWQEKRTETNGLISKRRIHPPRSRPGRVLRRQGPRYPRRFETTIITGNDWIITKRTWMGKVLCTCVFILVLDKPDGLDATCVK